jgi:hypothetical protein
MRPEADLGRWQKNEVDKPPPSRYFGAVVPRLLPLRRFPGAGNGAKAFTDVKHGKISSNRKEAR